jgi:hypothetical protein
MIKNIFLTLVFTVCCLGASRALASNIDGSITPGPQYAYGENLGWINFACDNCNVHITDTAVTGHAWSKQYGWINLNPDGAGVINNCAGQLGGKAWSRALGWLDFSGVSIDTSGIFTGLGGTPGTKAGRINFSCTNCAVATDWMQCSLRESPAQVVINGLTSTTIPTITANITITNEGTTNTEYQYEWCVVSDIANPCGGGDDVFYASGAKLIIPGENWNTTKDATVPVAGNYFFKLVVHYGVDYSTASQFFTATTSIPSGGGGGGGGGGTSTTPPVVVPNSVCSGADFNKSGTVDSIDFSMLLYFWKGTAPFKNPCIDINSDKKVDSVDFSILLSQWGKRSV